MLIFTHDKERLHEHFRRDPVMFAYHIGDLDDFFFGRCQWAASYYKSTRIDECILIYHAPFGSTVLAFGVSERFPVLLEEAVSLFPDRFYCHYLESYGPILRSRFGESDRRAAQRMKLGAFRPAHREEDERHMRRLDPSWAGRLKSFYAEAFEGCYYEPRMLETGKYFGWVEDSAIVAAAGVHVYSTVRRMAVLGNIATHPDRRGRGLATRLTSRLVSELVAENLPVCLNVMQDNVPAIRCYETLGFEKALEYTESVFSVA